MTNEEFCDKLAIQEIISRHGLFADCREFKSIKQLITPDATYDYSGSFGNDFKCVRLEDFLEGDDTFFAGFDATQHQITNFDIKLDGDRASARSHVRATHRIDKDIYVMGGLYRHQLVRVDGKWKICATIYEPYYVEGDATLFEKAALRVKNKSSKT